jgi:hypothetical protein
MTSPKQHVSMILSIYIQEEAETCSDGVQVKRTLLVSCDCEPKSAMRKASTLHSLKELYLRHHFQCLEDRIQAVLDQRHHEIVRETLR